MIEEVIMFKGFTNRCRKVINQYAFFEAERYNHSVIQPEHILIAILKEGQSNAYTIMNEVVDLINFQFILENYINKSKDVPSAENMDILLYYNLMLDVKISERTKQVLQIAIEESCKIGARQIDTFALFFASCKEEGSISQSIINKNNILLEELKNNYYKYITSSYNHKKDMNGNNTPNIGNDIYESESNDTNKLPEIKNVSFNKFIKNMDVPSFKDFNNFTRMQDAKKEKKMLDKDSKQTHTQQQNEQIEYLQDLNSYAREGKFQHIFGREHEIQQIFKVLLRKEKNNPVLIGDPGVGKSAIIEELALRIVEGRAPLSLLNTEILQLDVATLTAGTRYRGDFEERLLGIIHDIMERQKLGKNPVLFIDEFHHIVGAGLATGLSMDGAGILKPSLARGDLCCIGITTAEEYRKYVESDKAFLRRLQKIEISEMNEKDTYHTLVNIKPQYEEMHNVIYDDEAIHEIIRLSKDYIFDRFFPDKAVDLLDEIGAYYHLEHTNTPEELSKLFQEEQEMQNDIILVGNEMEEDGNMQGVETYLKKTDELQSVIERKNKLKDSLLKNIEQQEIIIDTDHVRHVVALSTGIPIDRLDANKTKSIQKLNAGLKKDVVGQKHAVSALVSTVKRSYAGLHKGNRPVGSFLFLGPTGVGKTYTAKRLAYYLFGSEDAVTRFDMSDFAESNSINRLIGAPPGYVGFEESGLLVKVMRRNPRQVLLFDEIEKAHSRVFDMFLQILEEGVLQGQLGEKATFKHSIIVMTSNIGSQELLAKKHFGFTNGEYNADYVHSIVHDELSNHFRPELINRFDEIMTFAPLKDKEIHNIIKLMTAELVQTLKEQGIDLKIQQSAYEFLYTSFYKVEYGARSIRRGLRSIENLIAETMIDKDVSFGDMLTLSAKAGDFSIRKQSQKHSEKHVCA